MAKLLSHTLGEEEASDFLLSDVAQPLVQQALSVQIGNGTNTPWGEPGLSENSSKPVMGESKARSAAAGGNSARKAKA